VVLVPRGRSLDRELVIELDLAQQLGLASCRKALDQVLETLGDPDALAMRAKTAKKPKVTLSIPGTWGRRRTSDVAIDGKVHAVQDGGFAVVLTALAAALRAPGSWASHAAKAAKSIHEAMSRVHAKLESALPPDFRLVEVTQVGCRLNPAVEIGDVAWEPLEAHPHPDVQKLAQSRRGRR
jgi:hypothetical protein